MSFAPTLTAGPTGRHLSGTLSLDLASRERRILRALVAEHTASGEPVGSRTISTRYELGLSPASVRSVLAHLEDLGLARQPHSSAGRLPTQRGYRYYVDALFEPRAPDPTALSAIDAQMRSSSCTSTGTLARETGRLLAALTGSVAVVTVPSPDDAVLTTVRFVPIDRKRLVAVLASRSGRIEHRTLDDLEELDEHELERLHNYLSTLTPGRTLRGLRDAVARDLEGARRELGLLHLRLERILEATVALENVEDRVSIEGQERLFHRHEFSDAEKIRAYVDAFASRQRWLSLLERTLTSAGIGIAIGDEAAIEGLDDVGIVAVRYGGTGSGAGMLAIVGPQRIDYAGAVPLLRYAARAVAEVLDSTSENCDDCIG